MYFPVFVLYLCTATIITKAAEIETIIPIPMYKLWDDGGIFAVVVSGKILELMLAANLGFELFSLPVKNENVT